MYSILKQSSINKQFKGDFYQHLISQDFSASERFNVCAEIKYSLDGGQIIYTIF